MDPKTTMQRTVTIGWLELQALMALAMSSDPSPVTAAEGSRVRALLDRAARLFGHPDWLAAYHAEHPRPIGSGPLPEITTNAQGDQLFLCEPGAGEAGTELRISFWRPRDLVDAMRAKGIERARFNPPSVHRFFHNVEGAELYDYGRDLRLLPEPSREPENAPEIELCDAFLPEGPLLVTTPDTAPAGTRFDTARGLVHAMRARGICRLRVRREQVSAIMPRFYGIAGVIGSIPDAEISVTPKGAAEAGEQAHQQIRFRKRRADGTVGYSGEAEADAVNRELSHAAEAMPIAGMTLHSGHTDATGGVAELTQQLVPAMAQRARLDALERAERLSRLMVTLRPMVVDPVVWHAFEAAAKAMKDELDTGWPTLSAGDSPDSAPGGHGPENAGSGDSVSPCDPAGGPTR